MTKSDVTKLAEDHWKYIEALLKAHQLNPTDISVVGFHYRSAFIHGYKHGQESLDTSQLDHALPPQQRLSHQKEKSNELKS